MEIFHLLSTYGARSSYNIYMYHDFRKYYILYLNSVNRKSDNRLIYIQQDSHLVFFVPENVSDNVVLKMKIKR